MPVPFEPTGGGAGSCASTDQTTVSPLMSRVTSMIGVGSVMLTIKREVVISCPTTMLGSARNVYVTLPSRATTEAAPAERSNAAMTALFARTPFAQLRTQTRENSDALAL